MSPTPPPVPANQRYPIQLRQFVTYQDQPGDANHIIETVDPSTGFQVTTDLTIDKAEVTTDLHTEIISIEQTIGTRPYTPPKCTTLGQAVNWLYTNKASRVHSHNHGQLTGLVTTGYGGFYDDHPQYMLKTGVRPFTYPVTAPAAHSGDQLVNYNQVTGAGYVTDSQFDSMLDASLASLGPEVTNPYGRLMIMGGVAQGYTDGNGNLWVGFGAGFPSAVLSFVYMKMPYGGLSMLGWYQYQYVEDQLILLSLNRTGAWIQFIEDIQVDRQALVSMCWQAIGV